MIVDTIDRILINALNGELTAMLKYERYANIAKKEKFENTAYFFQAISLAEKVHIKNHKNVLSAKFNNTVKDISVHSTLENIEEAIKSEKYEYKKMYPRLIKQLKKNSTNRKQKAAILSMEWAGKAEKIHAKFLNILRKKIKKGKEPKIEIIYYCRVCGNIHIGQKDLEICPICGHDTRFYMNVPRHL